MFVSTNFPTMVMSPTQAKALLGILTMMIQNYEKTWGTIATLPAQAADPYAGSTAALQ
jgi:hypothetical protein